jgi:hypothetical protein
MLGAPVSATELVDASGRVHHFLLAGVERMAGRAHVKVYFVLTAGRAGHESVAAAADHFYVRIVWMDIRFHRVFTSLA